MSGQDFFSALVYEQVLVFMALYIVLRRRDNTTLKIAFPIVWAHFYIAIAPVLMILLNGEIYNYPLILFYGSGVLAVYLWTAFRLKWPFMESLSFAFLINFFNSFFWEVPIHAFDLLEKGLTLNVISQCFHILPLIAFWTNYTVKDPGRLIRLVFLNVTATTFTATVLFFFKWNIPLSYGNRILSLVILIYIFTASGILERKF